MAPRSSVAAATAAAGLGMFALLTGCGSDPAPTGEMDQATEASTEKTDTARTEKPRRPATTRASARDVGNRPPVVRRFDIKPSDDDPTRWVAHVEADDPDGDDVRVDVVWLVNGQPVARDALDYNPTSNERGDRFHAEATPHDGKVAGATAASRVVQIANTPPEITSMPPASMSGGVYRYMVEARDVDGDQPLRYELAQGPDGMRIDPYNGELTWRPDANQSGSHPIVIAVSDNRGAKSTQEFVLPIVGAPGSAPAAPAP